MGTSPASSGRELSVTCIWYFGFATFIWFERGAQGVALDFGWFLWAKSVPAHCQSFILACWLFERFVVVKTFAVIQRPFRWEIDIFEVLLVRKFQNNQVFQVNLDQFLLSNRPNLWSQMDQTQRDKTIRERCESNHWMHLLLPAQRQVLTI